MKRAILLFSLLTSACGLDPAKVANHRLFVADGTEFVAPTNIQFAIVGNTRGMHPTIDRGNLGRPGVTHQLVGDVIASSMTGGPDFAVLTGDLVRSSSNSEWSNFDTQFVGLIDGATAPPVRTQRIPVIAVAGDRDGAGDTAYAGLSAAFPGTGASIGHGRVASWSHFDIASGTAKWRFIVLDSNKAAIGSRWREQITWLPKAIAGKYDGIIVLIHEPAYSLGGNSRGSEATRELLTALDRLAPMESLKAVIAAGPNVSQALLPEGPLGPLHIGAGGGGAPAIDLHRRAQAGKQTLTLAAGFDKSLQDRLHTWSGDTPLDDKVVEQAQASGTYAGTPGVYDGAAYPTHGWWLGEIEGATLRLKWRRWQPDGTFREAWKISYTRAAGWSEQE